MADDMLQQYDRANEWTRSKIAAAVEHMRDPSDCAPWDVRTLLNHMLESQRYFAASAAGKKGDRPGQQPADTLGIDPLAEFTAVHRKAHDAFAAGGGNGTAAPLLGIAMADTLLHGWDLAISTGQDATMPADLAERALERIHGRFTDEQRRGVFKPEIPVPDGASAQDKLLAYTGRPPSH
jgi:uncharacterized protein (TIGR03086 family)